MIPNKNFWEGYNVYVYNERFRNYTPANDLEATDVMENGILVPFTSSKYTPKHIILVTINDNIPTFYKAIKK